MNNIVYFIENEKFKNTLQKIINEEFPLLINNTINNDFYRICFIDVYNTSKISISFYHIVVGIVSDCNDIMILNNMGISQIISTKVNEDSLRKIVKSRLKFYYILNNFWHKYKFFQFPNFIDHIISNSDFGIAFVDNSNIFRFMNKKFRSTFYKLYNKVPEVNQHINKGLEEDKLTKVQKIINFGTDESSKITYQKNIDNNGMVQNFYFKTTRLANRDYFSGMIIEVNEVNKFDDKSDNLYEYYMSLIKENKIIEEAYSKLKRNNEKLQEAYKEMSYKTNVDYLTKLPNRLKFEEEVTKKINRYYRNNKQFVIAYGDIDDFKGVNDSFGHEAGDYVLVNIAQLFKRLLRSNDFVCRWGGEEFLFILDEENIQLCEMICNRLRKRVENYDFAYEDKSLNITITFGLALFDNTQSIEEVIKIADKRLYKGKNLGKNRVVIK